MKEEIYSLSRLKTWMLCPFRAHMHYDWGVDFSEERPYFAIGKAFEDVVHYKFVNPDSKPEKLREILETFLSDYVEHWKLWGDKNLQKVESAKKAIENLDEWFSQLYDSSHCEEGRKCCTWQQQLIIKTKTGHKVQGYADYFCRQRKLIIDIKTTGKRWKQHEEYNEEQPLFYANLLFQNFPDIQETEFYFYIVILTKKPSFDKRVVKVTKQQADLFMCQLDARIAMVKMLRQLKQQGYEYPANRQAWLCSHSECYAAKQCEAVHGWKIRR